MKDFFRTFFGVLAWLIIFVAMEAVSYIFFPNDHWIISPILFVILIIATYLFINRLSQKQERQGYVLCLSSFLIEVRQGTEMVLDRFRGSKTLGLGYLGQGFKEDVDFPIGYKFEIVFEQTLSSLTIPDLLHYISTKGKTANIQHLLHALSDMAHDGCYMKVFGYVSTDTVIFIPTLKKIDNNSDFELIIKFNILANRPAIGMSPTAPVETMLPVGLMFAYIVEKA